MPRIIDPETMNADDVPAIWSPVQWELSEAERIQELESQAIASLLRTADIPETILRLLLDETEIERAFEPPEDYNPEEQGEWDQDLLTFQFRRHLTLEHVEREQDYLYVEYKVEDLGYWALEIEPEKVSIYRL